MDLRPYCVAHWKCNDNAADNVVINSEGPPHGILMGGKTTAQAHVAGKVGGALIFDGTSDYINTNINANTICQSDFSVSMWIKKIEGQHFCGASKSGIPSNIFIIQCTVNGNGLILYYSANNIWGEPYVEDVLTSGVWYHIVGVVNQATPTTVGLKLYLDTTLIIDSTISNCIMSAFNVPYSIFVGTSSVNGNPHVFGLNLFSGSLDNVMVFNKALTQSEITRLYNNGNGTEDLTDIDRDPTISPKRVLRARYKF